MSAIEETSVQSLPNDIITHILTYLPSKPLTRFKLVSKSFLSLINDPDFIYLHIQRSISTLSNLSLSTISHPTNNLITLHLPTPDHPSPKIPTSKIPLPFTPHKIPTDIVGNCNGLLLCSAFPECLAVVNPISRTYEFIDMNTCTNRLSGETHWVDFGFGFDEIERDYKVVRVDQVHKGEVVSFVGGGVVEVGPREVQVYSLKKKSWKKVENFPYFLSHPMSHGRYLNICLHWIGITSDPAVFNVTGVLWRGRLDDMVYDYVLVVFDLDLEKFRVLELPDYDVGGELVVPRLSVGVLGGCLFVQVEHGRRFNRCVDIWVMKEYGVKESWSKLLRFRYEEVRGELMPVSILALSTKGDEVLMQQGEDCFWVELRSGNVRDVEIDGGLPFLYELVYGHKYGYGAVVGVESLVCLSNRFGDVEIEKMGNGVGKDEEVQAEEMKSKNKEPRRKRGDVLSSRFKLK